MAINTQKVIVAGLVAGIVALVLDFALNGFLLEAAHVEALNALNPELAEGLESPGTIVGFAVADVLWGIALVWLYAAIRPRFGAGPRTALIAALSAWIIVGIVWSTLSTIGIFSWGLFASSAVVWLVVSVAAAETGAALYKETPAA